ncbi:hypothetical protein AAE478_007984 [Parahypoxylon ruwenzoriense]
MESAAVYFDSPFEHNPKPKMTPALGSLPPEVLQLIVECFDPGCIKTGSRRPLGLHHRRQRAVLHSLCLTSKNLHHAATPFLYQHLAVIYPSHCTSLFCTFLENPALRQFARSFCFLADVADMAVMDGGGGWGRFSSYLQTRIKDVAFLESLDDRAQEVVSRIMTHFKKVVEPWKTVFLEYTVSAILLLLPCLDDILMELPQFTYGVFTHAPKHFWFMENIFGGSEPSWGPLLGSLRTLRIQGDPQTTGRPSGNVFDTDRSPDTGVLPDCVPQLFQAPNLRRIIFYGDYGRLNPFFRDINEHSSSTPVVSVRGQIEELGLRSSLASPGTASGLEASHVTGIEDLHLEEALEPVRECHQSLHFESFSAGYGQDNCDLIPTRTYEHRIFYTIGSLMQFPCLETLVIDLMTLDGPFYRHRLDENRDFDLSAALSPNLVELELIERSMDDTYGLRDYADDHTEWIYGVVTRFAKVCEAEKPHLRKFVFRGFDSVIATLEWPFGQAGVEFSWRLEPVERIRLHWNEI